MAREVSEKVYGIPFKSYAIPLREEIYDKNIRKENQCTPSTS